MKNKILKILTVLTLLTVLTMTNFIYIGMELVSYAVDGNDTVNFNAQLNEGENLLLSINAPNSSDLYNGVITLKEGESNFKFATSQNSQYIKVVEDRKIVLNTIGAGTNTNIELKIEPIKDVSFDIGLLDMSSKLYFIGEYKDNEGKDKTVSLEKEVKYEYTENNSNENIESTAKIITNKIVKVSGEDKRVVQLEMNLGLKENNYPIKEIELNLDVPSIISDATDTEYFEPDVKVKVDLNTMTHWESKYENHRLNIKFTNEANQNNKVAWKKQGSEKVVISFIFDKNAKLNGDYVKYINPSSDADVGEPRVKVILYNGKELNSVGTLKGKDVDEKYDQEQLVEVTTSNAENTIYKGKLNSGIDREYRTKTNIAVNLANAQEHLKLTEENKYIIRDDWLSAERNIVFNKTTIKKDEFVKIFGESGQMSIANENGETIATVDGNNEADEKGNIVINYEGKEPKILRIVTSTPISEGNLGLIQTKTIKKYNKELYAEVTDISTVVDYEYIQNQPKRTENRINLKDTISEVGLTSSVENFSTLNKSENVQITATLLSNNEKYELYKNPSIDIVIPKVFNIDVKTVTLTNYQEQFTISHNINTSENQDTIIHIDLQGEQLTFANNIDKGINIAIVADISASNTLPTHNLEITMKCTNQNKEGEELSATVPVKLNSKKGTLIVNRISGYNGNQVTESIEQEKNIQLSSTTEERTLTNEVYIINNNGQAMKDAAIILQFPAIDNESTFKNTYKGLNIEGDRINVLYSDNVNEEKDSTNWMDKDTILERKISIRAVKLTLVSGEIPESGVIKLTYNYTVPSNLKNTDSSYNNVRLLYKVNDIQEEATSKYKYKVNAESINPEEPKENDGNKDVGDKDGQEKTDTQEENQQFRIEQIVTSGDKKITKDDFVTEGQGITYTIKVTNITDKEIKNVKLTAKNQNATYFNIVKEMKSVYNDEMEVEKYKEDSSLESKELKIQTIKPGETQVVNYQISVAEVSDNNQILSGDIKITGDGIPEQTVEMQSNKIVKGQLKLNLEFGYDQNVYLSSGYGFPLILTVKNISEETLSDVEVSMPIAKQLEFSTKYLTTDYEDMESVNFVRVEGENIIFNIPSIRSGKESKIEVNLGVKDIQEEVDELKIIEYFKANANNREYISNNIEKTIYNNIKYLDLKLTSNVDGKSVKDGQEIVYYIDVKNNTEKQLRGKLTDEIPYELFVDKIIRESDGGQENIELNTKILNEEINLESGDTVRYIIKGTLHSDSATSNEITNKVQINGDFRSVSDILTYKIEGKENSNTDKEKTQEENTEKNEEDDKERQVNNDGTYSISGMAYEDSNNNGMRDSNEPVMSGLTVLLMDEKTGNIALDKNNKKMETVTSNQGTYSFENLNAGKYTVLFKFDANNYNVTEYKKAGVDESNNSDVLYKKIDSNEDNVSKYASTETLNLEEKDLTNINAGFVKKKKFDLKLDKTITKTIVQNSEETKQIDYDGTKLAKVEIKSQQMANSTVIVEYTIKVTNEGELSGYASEIIDYIPNGLKFSSEMNKTWYQGSDGNLLNRELANTLINPGETKAVKLTLSKTMTTSNTGTVINNAEISKTSNQNSSEDIDSIPGNRNVKEDDYSTAELIISIGTGSTIINILIISTIIVIMGVGIYFIKKKVLDIKKNN